MTVRAKSHGQIGVIERIVEPHRDKFESIDIVITPDVTLCWSFLDRLDFDALEVALEQALLAECSALAARSDTGELYAFVLGISPAHRSIEFFWNTELAWEKKLLKSPYGEDPFLQRAKYNGPDFEGVTLAYEDPAWSRISDILIEYDEVCTAYFDATGGGGIFYGNYSNRFQKTAVRALQRAMPKLRSLSKSANFVAFVQDLTGGGDQLYLALETIDKADLLKLMPWLFPDH